MANGTLTIKPPEGFVLEKEPKPPEGFELKGRTEEVVEPKGMRLYPPVQSIFDNEIPEYQFEDFLPIDIQGDVKRLIEESDNPDEMRAKLVNSLYYGQRLEESPARMFDLTAELNRGLSERAALSQRIEEYKKAKTYGKVIEHGLERAGMWMTKFFLGKTKMLGEFLTPSEKAMEKAVFPTLTEFEKKHADKLVAWSDMMLEGLKDWYKMNPEKEIQIMPGLGYAETLYQYIYDPKNLLQGLIESMPLVLEGITGTMVAGPAGGIGAMTFGLMGGTYADARDKGTSPKVAMTQDIITSLGEATIEQWTLGRKLGLMKNFRKIVSEGFGNVLWEGTKAFFRGTAEEGSQEWWRNFWNWVFTDRSQKWSENVAESMAAGGPIEMVMALGFSGAGAIGAPVAKEQKLKRIQIIRDSVEESPLLDDTSKTEMLKELAEVEGEVNQGIYKEPAPEIAEKPPVPAAEEITPTEPAAVAEEAVTDLAKELEVSLKLTPEKALEIARKKLAYEAEIKAKEALKVKEEIEPKKRPPKLEEMTAEEIRTLRQAAAQAIGRKAFPGPEKTVEVVSEQSTVQEIIAEAELTEQVEEVEPIKIITKPHWGKIDGVPFTTVPQGEKLYKTEAIARTAQMYENKIAKLKTRLLEARRKGQTKLENQLTKQRLSLLKKLQQTRQSYEKRIAHIKSVIARQKEVRVLRDKIKKLAKKIAKPAGPSIDVRYRLAIERLQAGIDPFFRAKKTLRMREKTKQFLEQKPEKLKDMPVKLLKKIAKKSIQEYTVEELESIATEVERLRKQGTLKRKLKTAQRQRKLTQKAEQISEKIMGSEAIDFDKGPVVFSTTMNGLVQTKLEKTKAWTWRPARIFDLLDGKADFAGEAHEFFIDKVNEATNAKLRMEDKRRDAGEIRRKELDIGMGGLSTTREIDGIRYTIDEMIGVYNASKNPLATLAVKYGNNIDEAAMSKIIENLTDAEEMWGDYIVRDYEENYDRLREAVIEVENRDMGYEENYTPIRRTEVDYSTHTQEIVDAIMQKEGLRKAYAQHGFTIPRKQVPAEFQKPIRLNATGVWLEQIKKQEQYIHLAEHVRDMHRIAANKEFREAIKQKYGAEFNKVIKSYIDRCANPNIYKSYNSLENLSRTMRQHAAVAYLAYNLLTMGKQIPSALLYLPDSGVTHLISSAGQFIADPVRMIRFVRETDPQVKHKAIERELEELKSREPGLYNSMFKKVGRAGMKGIYMFDTVARTIGWNAVYQKALKDGKSIAEAARLAQNSTLRTQPTAAAKDLAQLYATNEFANWFTMFTNQLNQIWNIATYDMSGYVKRAEYARFALSILGMALVAETIWIMTHRKFPEDKEEIADAGLEQAINAVPLVGKAIMVGKKGWGDTEIPAFELPKAAGRAGRKIAQGKFTNSDLRAIAEGTAVTIGAPYIGIKRMAEFAETGELKTLIGAKEKKTKKTIPRKRLP